jgi:hypothetical protein
MQIAVSYVRHILMMVATVLGVGERLVSDTSHDRLISTSGAHLVMQADGRLVLLPSQPSHFPTWSTPPPQSSTATNTTNKKGIPASYICEIDGMSLPSIEDLIGDRSHIDMITHVLFFLLHSQQSVGD